MVKIKNCINEPIELFMDNEKYVIEAGAFVKLEKINLPKTIKIQSHNYDCNKINLGQYIFLITKGIVKSLFCVLFQEFFNKHFFDVSPYSFICTFVLSDLIDDCTITIKENKFHNKQCKLPEISSNCNISFNNVFSVNFRGFKCKWIEILSSFIFVMVVLFVIFACILVSSISNSNILGSVIAVVLILSQIPCIAYFVSKENKNRMRIIEDVLKNI